MPDQGSTSSLRKFPKYPVRLKKPENATDQELLDKYLVYSAKNCTFYSRVAASGQYTVPRSRPHATTSEAHRCRWQLRKERQLQKRNSLPVDDFALCK